MASKKTAISVLLAPDLASAIQERALLEGKTKTDIVALALAEWLMQSSGTAGIDSISSAWKESADLKLFEVISNHETALKRFQCDFSRSEQNRLAESLKIWEIAQSKLISASEAILISESGMLKSVTELVSYAKSIETTGRKSLEESTKRISAPAEKVMKQLAETIISIGQLRSDLAVSAQDFSRKTFRDLVQFYMTVLIALLLVVFARSSATGIQVGHTELIAVSAIMVILILFFDNPFKGRK